MSGKRDESINIEDERLIEGESTRGNLTGCLACERLGVFG